MEEVSQTSRLHTRSKSNVDSKRFKVERAKSQNIPFKEAKNLTNLTMVSRLSLIKTTTTGGKKENKEGGVGLGPNTGTAARRLSARNRGNTVAGGSPTVVTPNGSGPATAGLNNSGTGSSLTGSNGTTSTTTTSTGAGSSGTGSSGTGSTGTGSTGTGSTGTGSTGPGSTGTGSTGTGSNGTGSNGTGSNGTGSTGTGTWSSGTIKTERIPSICLDKIQCKDENDSESEPVEKFLTSSFIRTKESTDFNDKLKPASLLRVNSLRVTTQELETYRKILIEILEDDDKKNKFRDFTQKIVGQDTLLVAYETLTSFEKQNSKVAPALMKSIAESIWDTVNNSSVSLNFPAEIIESVMKNMKAEKINADVLFSPVKEYIFDVMAARLIPKYRAEFAFNSVSQQIEKIKTERSFSDKENMKNRKSRLSLALLSPRKETHAITSPELKMRRKESAILRTDSNTSWIEKQRKEREIIEGKKIKKRKIPSKVDKKDTRMIRSSSGGSTTVSAVGGENPISTSHISWQDVHTLETMRAGKAKSDLVADYLIAELDLSEAEFIPELLLSPKTPQNTYLENAQRDVLNAVTPNTTNTSNSTAAPTSTHLGPNGTAIATGTGAGAGTGTGTATATATGTSLTLPRPLNKSKSELNFHSPPLLNTSISSARRQSQATLSTQYLHSITSPTAPSSIPVSPFSRVTSPNFISSAPLVFTSPAPTFTSPSQKPTLVLPNQAGNINISVPSQPYRSSSTPSNRTPTCSELGGASSALLSSKAPPPPTPSPPETDEETNAIDSDHLSFIETENGDLDIELERELERELDRMENETDDPSDYDIDPLEALLGLNSKGKDRPKSDFDLLKARLEQLQKKALEMGITHEETLKLTAQSKFDKINENDEEFSVFHREGELEALPGQTSSKNFAEKLDEILDLFQGEEDELLKEVLLCQEEDFKKEDLRREESLKDEPSSQPLKDEIPRKLDDSNKWVVLRKLGATRGGVKMRLPSTLEELIESGSRLLKIKGAAVREFQTEAAILDISAIESDILYLTTAEEEDMF